MTLHTSSSCSLQPILKPTVASTVLCFGKPITVVRLYKKKSCISKLSCRMLTCNRIFLLCGIAAFTLSIRSEYLVLLWTLPRTINRFILLYFMHACARFNFVWNAQEPNRNRKKKGAALLYLFKGKQIHRHVQMLCSPTVLSRVCSISCRCNWIFCCPRITTYVMYCQK